MIKRRCLGRFWFYIMPLWKMKMGHYVYKLGVLSLHVCDYTMDLAMLRQFTLMRVGVCFT